jgi:hypothetical protein
MRGSAAKQPATSSLSVHGVTRARTSSGANADTTIAHTRTISLGVPLIDHDERTTP